MVTFLRCKIYTSGSLIAWECWLRWVCLAFIQNARSAIAPFHNTSNRLRWRHVCLSSSILIDVSWGNRSHQSSVERNQMLAQWGITENCLSAILMYRKTTTDIHPMVLWFASNLFSYKSKHVGWHGRFVPPDPSSPAMQQIFVVIRNRFTNRLVIDEKHHTWIQKPCNAHHPSITCVWEFVQQSRPVVRYPARIMK